MSGTIFKRAKCICCGAACKECMLMQGAWAAKKGGKFRKPRGRNERVGKMKSLIKPKMTSKLPS